MRFSVISIYFLMRLLSFSNLLSCSEELSMANITNLADEVLDEPYSLPPLLDMAQLSSVFAVDFPDFDWSGLLPSSLLAFYFYFLPCPVFFLFCEVLYYLKLNSLFTKTLEVSVALSWSLPAPMIDRFCMENDGDTPSLSLGAEPMSITVGSEMNVALDISCLGSV